MSELTLVHERSRRCEREQQASLKSREAILRTYADFLTF